ncbi:MAG TPA: SLBB domain-containing protein, partial [Candidatus Cloacimonadota bacterium]|nr:SLBB domain-containing protein [Candidatus Cloacimonadota bacterium]
YNILDDMNNNPYIQNGDIIYIPSKIGEVEISGAVNKEGIYDYSPGDKLYDIINLALGLNFYADLENVEIFRHNTQSESERIIVDLSDVINNPDSQNNVALEVGDRIYVRFLPHYDENAQIMIQGEVQYPGFYSIIDAKTTLLELLEMAGGPSDMADLSNSFLQRRSKEDKQDAEFERLKNMLVEDMTEMEYQYFKAKSLELQGKFSIDFQHLWETKNPALNIVLKDKDYIFIARRSNVVQVSGQVKNPGLITYVPGKTFQYYIEKADGYAWNARKGKVQLIKANTGEKLKPGKNDIIEVQDMIFVPEKEAIDYWELAKDAFLVISQVATTILVIQNVTQ